MPRQRLADFLSNSLSFRLINECCSTSCFVPGRGRLIGNESGFLARQNFLTGQIPHFGLHGRHTNAPRSSSAELYAAEHFFGARKAAYFQSAFRPAVESIGIRKSKKRDKMREVFDSTIAIVL